MSLKKQKSINSKKQMKNNESKIRNIYSVDEFRAIVSYERSRCDRENTSFSVILIESKVFVESSVLQLSKLIQKLRGIMRGIDHLGWWKHGVLAVLLPSTSEEGATICLNKISELFSNRTIKIEPSIFCYPNHWLEESFGDDDEEDYSCEAESITFKKVFTPGVPVWKRCMDFIGAFIGLTLLLPLFIVVAAYIKIVSSGKVFFIQKRIGFCGKEFSFLKFRTMHEGNNEAFHGNHAKRFINNADTPMAKLDDIDPRIIPGGKILRKLCIDELPQLINVLIGDMSLVGPRPCIPYEKESYLRWHTHRFDVIPGMTGLWQVSGKNKLTFKQMIRLDIAYCRNLSFFSDLKILLLTIPAILKIVIESANKAEIFKEEKISQPYTRLRNIQSKSS